MPSLRSARVVMFVVLAGLVFAGSGCRRSYHHHSGTSAYSGPSDDVTPAGPSVRWTSTSNPPAGSVIQLFAMINAARNARGDRSLVWHDGLAAVATNHSQDMKNRNYINLVAPEGYDVFQQLVNASPPMSFDNMFAMVFTFDVNANGGNHALTIYNLLQANPDAWGALMDPAMTQFACCGVHKGIADTLFVGQNVRP